MILYGFVIDFIWFYMIFGGVAGIFGWPVFLNFDRKFQVPPKCSDDPFFWILNVRPEIRRTTEMFGWPVFLNFERSTRNSTYHRNCWMALFRYQASTGHSRHCGWNLDVGLIVHLSQTPSEYFIWILYDFIWFLVPKQKEARLGWGSYLVSIELPCNSRIARCQGT